MPPDERRAAIVRAALPLLVERGDAVTTREVARAAGVAEGTIFNVFDDKDELIAAVLDAALDQEPFERSIRHIDGSAPFEDQLVEATRLIQHRVVDVWRLISSLGHHRHRHDAPLPLSPALTALFARHDAHLTVDAPDAARLLRALTLSLTHPTLTVEPLPAERIVALFLHGAAGHPAR